MKNALVFCLALVPQAAWAHGDHSGPGGVLHVLASPEHLAVLLLVGTGLSVLAGRRPSRCFEHMRKGGD